jgi:hypothetical protein
MIATFVGLYLSPGFSSIRPRRGQTSMNELVLNAALVLLVSSSFPAFSRTLGVTSFDLIGYYRMAHYVQNRAFDICYKTAFMIMIGKRLLDAVSRIYSTLVSHIRFTKRIRFK